MSLDSRLLKLERRELSVAMTSLRSMSDGDLDAYIAQMEREHGIPPVPDVTAMSDSELEAFTSYLCAGGAPRLWRCE